MQLRIRPARNNSYPVTGIFIKGDSIYSWLKTLRTLAIDLERTEVFAVAGKSANSLSGCVVVCDADVRHLDIGPNDFLQLVQGRLFVPMFTTLFPETDAAEWNNLLGHHKALLHPETGLSLLETPINWLQLIALPEARNIDVRKPHRPKQFPQFVSSIFVEPDPTEAENPFGPIDMKLPFNIEKVLKGNNREIDKFLKYLEKNPELALTLGIPLDIGNTSRGSRDLPWRGSGTRFTGGDDIMKWILGSFLILVFIAFMIKMAQEKGSPGIGVVFLLIILLARLFSSGSDSGRGGTRTVDNDRFTRLQRKYEELAEMYKKQGDYRKAAHIENKLLKRTMMAALTLEKGKHFQEAAQLFLSIGNKELAAKAYENGRMYREAAELYKTLGQNEKAGDMYLLTNQRLKAIEFFAFAASEHIKASQYVKASLIYSEKMDDRKSAQDYLIEGWRKHADGENCLNLYFRNLRAQPNYMREIENVYENDVDKRNYEPFLNVLRKEFKEKPEHQQRLRDIAFEIVSARCVGNPEVTSQLISFTTDSNLLVKDVMKFKWQHRKMKSGRY